MHLLMGHEQKEEPLLSLHGISHLETRLSLGCKAAANAQKNLMTYHNNNHYKSRIFHRNMIVVKHKEVQCTDVNFFSDLREQWSKIDIGQGSKYLTLCCFLQWRFFKRKGFFIAQQEGAICYADCGDGGKKRAKMDFPCNNKIMDSIMNEAIESRPGQKR